MIDPTAHPSVQGEYLAPLWEALAAVRQELAERGGLSLRQQAACLALGGLAHRLVDDKEHAADPDDLAAQAVELADALVRRLAGSEEEPAKP